MKKTLKILLASLLVVCTMFALVACKATIPNGDWYECDEDGVISEETEVAFTIDGDKIMIDMDGDIKEYTISDNKFSMIEGGMEVVFTLSYDKNAGLIEMTVSLAGLEDLIDEAIQGYKDTGLLDFYLDYYEVTTEAELREAMIEEMQGSMGEVQYFKQK